MENLIIISLLFILIIFSWFIGCIIQFFEERKIKKAKEKGEDLYIITIIN